MVALCFDVVMYRILLSSSLMYDSYLLLTFDVCLLFKFKFHFLLLSIFILHGYNFFMIYLFYNPSLCAYFASISFQL